MNLIHTVRPTDKQKKEMSHLVDACRAKEPLSLGAPIEDDLGYDILLLYEKDASLAAMSFLFYPEEGPCECCVFVDPARRRRGHFAFLLDKTLDLAEAYEKKAGRPIDFCFLADERTPSAMAALKSIGAEYWYSEHKMERLLTPRDKIIPSGSLVIEKDCADDSLYCAFLEGMLVGTCAVLTMDKELYLYAFQIREDFRGKGYGKEFLLGMLRLLSDMGTRVVIQVSGQNYIARNLYKKTGFRTTESLSYYLY